MYVFTSSVGLASLSRLRLVSPRVGAGHAVFRLHLKVEIIPQEIGRVLLNLLGNAFDAVHEKTVKVNSEYDSTVTVSTRQVDGQMEIR